VVDGAAPSEGALLLVRLWPAAKDGTNDEQFWESGTPAAGLTLDLIAASDGVRAATLGRMVVARVPSVESAVATARRLQWAIQGFAEGEGLQETAATALVHGGTEIPGPLAESAWVATLEKANPGQILLTEEACQAVAQVPGYALAAAVAGSPRELAWRGPQSKTDRGEDEQTLSRLIELSGNRVEEVEERLPAPAMVVPRPEAEDFEIPEETPRSSRKGLMIAIAAVLVLGVGVAGAMFLRKPASAPETSAPAASGPASAVPATTSPAAASPTNGTAQSPASATTATASDQKLSARELRAQKREQKKEAQQAAQGTPAPAAPAAAATDTHPPPKATGGRCEIDESQYAQYLDMADHSYASGKYPAAVRQYGMVLDCQPGNGHARDGLEKARRSQQMDSEAPE
jgi:hypothetical protein